MSVKKRCLVQLTSFCYLRYFEYVYPMLTKMYKHYLNILLVVLFSMVITGCYRPTLSVVQAPITQLHDWQPIKSSSKKVTYTARIGKMLFYRDNQTIQLAQQDIATWFKKQLQLNAVKVITLSPVQIQNIATQHAKTMYAIAKNQQQQWRRYEIYVLKNQVVWIDIDNNVDSKSYEEMLQLLTNLVHQSL